MIHLLFVSFLACFFFSRSFGSFVSVCFVSFFNSTNYLNFNFFFFMHVSFFVSFLFYESNLILVNYLNFNFCRNTRVTMHLAL